MSLDALAAEIRARAEGRARFVFAIAGPPGAGKSTLAEALLAALDGRDAGARRRWCRWTAITSTTRCSPSAG